MENIFKKFKLSFVKITNQAKENGALVFATVIITFILMFSTCIAIFFTSVRGPEQVMVPNVIGKSLVSALFEMQEKELYPKIQLRYSETDEDKGKIIEQNPAPGAIVKAYRRVTITISRGLAMDFLQDFTGKNIEQTLEALELTFGSENSLIKIETVNLADSSEKGTIIAQEPEEGTDINDIEKIVFIVSSGEKSEETTAETANE